MARNAILPTCALLCVLLIGTVVPHYGIATSVWAATTLVGPGFALPRSATSVDPAGKYPSVATVDSTVHMVSNTNKQSQYWSKQDTASSASGPTIFGGTGGDTDY